MRELLSRVSLRVRMVALATVVVAAILLLAGAALAVGLRASLLSSAVEAATVRAEELAAIGATGPVPSPIPVAGQDEALAQVVVDGRVVASSSNIEGEGPLPLSSPTPGAGAMVRPVTSLPIEDDDDRFRVVSAAVETPQGTAVVHVAVSVSEIDEVVATTAQIGLLGLPVLLVVLAGLLWVVVGRTLAPIEALRRRSDEISIEDLHQRVPEPATRDEVGRLARTLNAMLDRLENGVQRQRRFVGDAAHELRTPLATLRAQLETARDAHAVDWSEVSDDVLAETLRMQRLTEQLLLLARLDAAAEQHHRPVDLDDVVVGAVRSLRERTTTHIDTRRVAPVQLAGNPVLLGQAVANLLDNAARHASEQVRVTLDEVDGAAVLEVDDDGPGIPAAQREAVLERFTRLDEARARDDGGAGLGLAIVADIARAHHGSVTVQDSADLGGARLRLTLPVAPNLASP